MRQWAGHDTVAARLEAALSEVIGQALKPAAASGVAEQKGERQLHRVAA